VAEKGIYLDRVNPSHPLGAGTLDQKIFMVGGRNTIHWIPCPSLEKAVEPDEVDAFSAPVMGAI
jgi:hypothetical protein